LPDVQLPEEVAKKGLDLIKNMQVDSLRAEITLFEAARAYAAADGRSEVQLSDLEEIVLLVLRGRRSNFILEFFSNQETEEMEIESALKEVLESKPLKGN
jgi:magnesium chelatase subunit I